MLSYLTLLRTTKQENGCISINVVVILIIIAARKVTIATQYCSHTSFGSDMLLLSPPPSSGDLCRASLPPKLLGLDDYRCVDGVGTLPSQFLRQRVALESKILQVKTRP